MALQMPYDDPDTGAHYDTSYWKVLGATLRAPGQAATIFVQGYVHSDASSNNRMPIRRDEVTVPAADVPTVFPGAANISTIPQRSYNYLKTLPFFGGATDV